MTARGHLPRSRCRYASARAFLHNQDPKRTSAVIHGTCATRSTRFFGVRQGPGDPASDSVASSQSPKPSRIVLSAAAQKGRLGCDWNWHGGYPLRVDHSGNPAFRRPSSRCAWSSGRNHGARLRTYMSNEADPREIAFSSHSFAPSVRPSWASAAAIQR